MTFRQKLIPILSLVLLIAIGVTVWDGQRRLGERVLGRQTLLNSSASESGTLTTDIDTTVTTNVTSEHYLSLLSTLNEGVYQLHLTQIESALVSSDYRVVVTPEWTMVTAQAMVIENGGSRDEVLLSPDQQTSYTHYQQQDNGELLAQTYTRVDDRWQVSAQVISSDQQDLTYGHLWSVVSLPVADESGRLTAPARDGGTYHFYFANTNLTKVELISDTGDTKLEYHRANEPPEIDLPADLQEFIKAQ